MLECNGQRLYTGIAKDVSARFAKHQAGTGAKFTRSFPPSRILKEWAFPSKSFALKAEIQMKKFSKEKKQKVIKSWTDKEWFQLLGMDQ